MAGRLKAIWIGDRARMRRVGLLTERGSEDVVRDVERS